MEGKGDVRLLVLILSFSFVDFRQLCAVHGIAGHCVLRELAPLGVFALRNV